MGSVHTTPLAVVGCDFRIAPSRARSSLAMTPEETEALARSLKTGGWAEGLVVLDTCNRNEWLVASEDPTWAGELLQSRMRQRLPQELQGCITPYVRIGDEAARHLFRVAIGQESLVVGERQISGQLFKAMAIARAQGHSAKVFHDLEATIGRLVRIAQKRGQLEANSVGVHSLALAWLRAHRAPVTGRVAVVGMGVIGRKVAALLDADPQWTPTRFNRTVSEDRGYRPLSELEASLGQVDAALFCTAAPAPVFDPASLDAGDRPTLIDLGIPEQVVRQEGAATVGLDELVAWHEARSSENGRTDAAPMGELLDRALTELHRAQQQPPLAPVLEQVRSRSRALVRTEIRALLERKLTTVSAAERGQIEDDLAALLGTYTDDVFQTIRGASPDGDWVDP